MNREYDLFEKFPDGAPVWRQHVVGLLNAREMLKAIASTTLNECFVIQLPSKEIVARLNVKQAEDDDLFFPSRNSLVSTAERTISETGFRFAPASMPGLDRHNRPLHSVPLSKHFFSG